MSGKLVSIQYLRAVAALMVLAYHTARWADRSFAIGAAGVDVFFIISGFILWTIAAERPLPPAEFLMRRLTRVAPLYWVLTLAVTALAVAVPTFFFDAKPAFWHVLLSLAFVPHLNTVGLPFPLISAGWSLTYEAIFYLVFAASLLARPEHRFRWLAWGLGAIVVMGLVVRPAYYLGFNLMFLQFLAGAWLARRRLAAGLPGRKIGWLLVAFAVLAFGAISSRIPFEDLLRPIWWGVPALALVSGLLMVEDDGGLPNLPWLRFLGDASYSIYLTHVVVTEALFHVMDTRQFIYMPIAVATSLAVGIACHLFVEKPLLTLFRSRPRAALPSGAI